MIMEHLIYLEQILNIWDSVLILQFKKLNCKDYF